MKENQKIRPLHDSVVIRVNSRKKESENILVIQYSKKCPVIQGVILDVGAGRYNKEGVFIPTKVKKGWVVCWGQYSGMEIEINGEKLLIIGEEKLNAVIES